MVTSPLRRIENSKFRGVFIKKSLFLRKNHNTLAVRKIHLDGHVGANPSLYRKGLPGLP